MEPTIKQRLRDWLSLQAKAFKESVFYLGEDDKKSFASTFTTDGIHMDGSRRVAMALNIPLKEEPWENDGYVATYVSFVYEDVEFYSLENFRYEED